LLVQLLEAFDTAVGLGCPIADMAALVSVLFRNGGTDGQLRALLAAGHIEAVNSPPEGPATVQPAGPLAVGATTRVVLTPQGAGFVRRLLTTEDVGPAGSIVVPAPRPFWSAATSELLWRGVCIKRFRHDAANQRRLLDAFEGEGWPARLRFTLPAMPRRSGKARLHETIKSLNRGQKALRFHGDGTGQGVRWEANG
jgi:hypothetical protein